MCDTWRPQSVSRDPVVNCVSLKDFPPRFSAGGNCTKSREPQQLQKSTNHSFCPPKGI